VIDHIGFPVSDYERSKAFYDKALVPLGYVLIMEVGHAGNGDRAAGFGRAGKPEIWIGEEGGVGTVVHVAIAADDPRRSMPSTAPRSRPAAPTTARPDCGPTIIRITTRLSRAIPTATMWRRCATAPPDRPRHRERSVTRTAQIVGSIDHLPRRINLLFIVLFKRILDRRM